MEKMKNIVLKGAEQGTDASEVFNSLSRWIVYPSRISENEIGHS